MGLSFLFGIHCHQPVDNFSNVVDEVSVKSYIPFIDYAIRYEKFRFAVHYSGWLLDYIKHNFPELFKKFKILSERGQIEFFTGGYYEPVLSSIPRKDRIGQINKLSSYLYENFGQSPKGLWLTERVWDPSIIPDVVECGVEYLVVDDYHFISTGFHKDSLYGYYLTEQDGFSVKVFPIDQRLRYIVPFREPEEIEKYLLSIIDRGAKGAVLFDDGEKFGVWPKTYEWVYKEGWLDRFFDKFIFHKEIEFTHYSEFASKEKPLGLAYLPMTSYMEMGQWSLFPDKALIIEKLIGFVKKTEYADYCELFVKGSHWKNFFIKYPESNHIHKRVLDISKRMEEVQYNEKLEDILFRSECNDVFWHGIFGGIYLPNLRDNAFRYIIEAEKILDNLSGNLEGSYFKDILFDGYGCYIIKNSFVNTLFTLKHGGQLKSLDIREASMNLVNTLSRRWEGYHDKLINVDGKEKNNDSDTGITTIHEMGVTLGEDLKKEIAFDWYDRNCFVDHFVERFNAEDMKNSSYREIGDFVNQPFNYVVENGSLYLKRIGGIYLDEKFESCVEKRFTLTGKKLSFQYDISTNYKKNIFYVLEMNLHFYDYNNLLINGKGIKKLNKFKSGNIEIVFDGYSININIDKEVKLFVYKVNTVHQSEQGVDFTTQGISLLFPFNMKEKLVFSGYIELNEVS